MPIQTRFIDSPAIRLRRDEEFNNDVLVAIADKLNKEEKKKESHQKSNKISDFFSRQEKKLTFGVEAEMYLLKDGKLSYNDDIMNNILNNVPDQITKDYYPCQIEIRTDPHDNPKDLNNQFISLLKTTARVCGEYGCEIIPLSWLGGSETFNGVHYHIRYSSNKNPYWKMMMNSYPFILSLTHFFRNSPSRINELSYRMINSQHIGLPIFDPRDFEKYCTGSNRYKDIIINKHRENNRHRKKSVNTLEIRCFDVPYMENYFKSMSELVFSIYSRLKVSSLVLPPKTKNFQEYKKFASDTRNQMLYSRYPKNNFFGLSHNLVVKKLCKILELEFLDKPYPLTKKHYHINEYKEDSKFCSVIQNYNMGKEKINIKKTSQVQNNASGFLINNSDIFLRSTDSYFTRDLIFNYNGANGTTPFTEMQSFLYENLIFSVNRTEMVTNRESFLNKLSDFECELNFPNLKSIERVFVGFNSTSDFIYKLHNDRGTPSTVLSESENGEDCITFLNHLFNIAEVKWLVFHKRRTISKSCIFQIGLPNLHLISMQSPLVRNYSHVRYGGDKYLEQVIIKPNEFPTPAVINLITQYFGGITQESLNNFISRDNQNYILIKRICSRNSLSPINATLISESSDNYDLINDLYEKGVRRILSYD